MPHFIILCALAIALFMPVSSSAAVTTGAERLSQESFQSLRDKKFALVTNQTAQAGGMHLINLMERSGVKPAVIFTPEHGLLGTTEDGVHLSDGIQGGIPVKSLYGASRKPRAEDLKGIELLVFDIQDIGVRFYTYISTMGLVMQAAAEAGIPFMVLDRPNPLGGNYVSGFPRSELPRTFTSFYPIPVVHGLTVGELAGMIKGEAMLPGLQNLDLRVVRMEGWQRWMRWPDTGLPFVATSPNIPVFETSLLYAGTGVLESTGASEGRGTLEPFQLLGWPGIDAEALAQKLNSQGLSGLRFAPVQFTPRPIPGKSSKPKYQGKVVNGVRIEITDYRRVLPVEAGVALLAGIYSALPEPERRLFFRRGFDDMAGSPLLRSELLRGADAATIADRWSDPVAQFMKKREPYLLYLDTVAATAADQEE